MLLLALSVGKGGLQDSHGYLSSPALWRTEPKALNLHAFKSLAPKKGCLCPGLGGGEPKTYKLFIFIFLALVWRYRCAVLSDTINELRAGRLRRRRVLPQTLMVNPRIPRPSTPSREATYLDSNRFADQARMRASPPMKTIDRVAIAAIYACHRNVGEESGASFA